MITREIISTTIYFTRTYANNFIGNSTVFKKWHNISVIARKRIFNTMR